MCVASSIYAAGQGLKLMDVSICSWMGKLCEKCVFVGYHIYHKIFRQAYLRKQCRLGSAMFTKQPVHYHISLKIKVTLRAWIHYQGRLLRIVLLTFSNGVCSRADLFFWRAWCAEKQTKGIKVVSLVTNDQKWSMYIKHPKLRLSTLGKNFSRQNSFSYFSLKTGFDISCKLSPQDKMSNLVFWEK